MAIRTEYIDDYKLIDPNSKLELEKNMAQSIERDRMSIVRYQQEIGSNPIGIGEIIRSKHNPYWKSEEWEEVYEKALLKLSLKPNFLVLLTN